MIRQLLDRITGRIEDPEPVRYWATPAPQPGNCQCSRCKREGFASVFTTLQVGAVCDTAGEVAPVVCVEVMPDLAGVPGTVVLTSDGDPVDLFGDWDDGVPSGPAVYVEVWGRFPLLGNEVRLEDAGWFDPVSRQQVGELLVGYEDES